MYRASLDGFVLGWPGSIHELTLIGPDGNVVAQPAASTRPISVVVPKARAGTWHFQRPRRQSAPGEAWWAVVGRG